MLENHRDGLPATGKRYQFRSPRKEPPVSFDGYLEGPPPSPSRPKDDE